MQLMMLTQILLYRNKRYRYMLFPGIGLALPILVFALFTNYSVTEYMILLMANGIAGIVIGIILGVVEILRRHSKKKAHISNHQHDPSID